MNNTENCIAAMESVTDTDMNEWVNLGCALDWPTDTLPQHARSTWVNPIITTADYLFKY